MIHYMHQNSNEPANIELDYAMQTYIPTFCPPTYSFNFIWLFCFFCGVCVTLLCPHSGRSKTVSFFEFWICIYNYAMDMQKRAKSLGAVYMFHVYSRWKVFNWLRLFAFRFFMINHIQNKLFSDFAATR